MSTRVLSPSRAWWATLVLAMLAACSGNHPATTATPSEAAAETPAERPAKKVALIGASGHAGSEILKELHKRGYQVTAIARRPERIAALPGVTPVAADANDGPALTELLRGHDALISAVRFSDSDPAILIAAARDAGVPRYLVVGGAASLLTPDGTRLFDTPAFPDAYKGEAGAGIAFLDALKASEGIDWTFLSPSAEFVDGERTGTFRTGKDELLVDAQGRSWISFATTPSRWPTNWRTTRIRASASPSATDRRPRTQRASAADTSGGRGRSMKSRIARTQAGCASSTCAAWSLSGSTTQLRSGVASRTNRRASASGLR